MNRPNVSDVLAWSSVYRTAGLHMIPVEPNSKRPAIEEWQRSATTDSTTLAEWFSTPRNIGVVCGPSGIVVVDIDTHGANGFETLAALEADLGALPETVTSESGGGGEHRLFRMPSGVDLKYSLGPGVDLMHDSKQIVVCPSIHPSGRPYRWRNAPDEYEIAELPAAWIRHATREQVVTSTHTTVPTGEDFYSDLASLDQGYVLRCISGTPLVGGESIELKGSAKGKRQIWIEGKSTGGFLDENGRIGHRSTSGSAEGPDGGPLASTWCRHYGHSDRDIRRMLIEHVPELAKFGERRIPTRTTTATAAAGESPDGEQDYGEAQDTSAEPSRGGSKKPSIATTLVALAREQSTLWRSTDGDAYATVDVDGHREHMRVGSTEHRRWMARLGWQELRAAVGDTPIRSACSTLSGLAVHDGEEHPIYVRVAGDGERVWIDLCDPHWRVIEIDRDGWRIVGNTAVDVRFARRSAMRPLPDPEVGGTLDELRKHVRITDESWARVAGWLVGALSPRGPYPVLVFRGEHGAGKSMSARRLRSLIDPSVAPIRSEPREPRDLVITAKAAHVAAYDNLSTVPPWLSDGLCRLATGGGYAARALFTDSDEIVIDVQRPTILTGITDVVTAPDLLDRALLVELDSIAPEDRQTERVLDQRWASAQPRILGALCTAVSTALRRRDQITINRLPRLADWATWATAAEPALGLADGSVLAALDDQEDEAVEIGLEASPIAEPIRALVASRTDRAWQGTPSELLHDLNERYPHLAKERAWPRTPRGLSGAIARIAPSLRKVGLEVEKLKPGEAERGKRGWRFAHQEDKKW